MLLKDVSSSSNVQRQIIKFGGSTGGGGGGSGSRRSSRAFSGRHSFTEPEQEDIEATGTELTLFIIIVLPRSYTNLDLF